MDPTILPRLIGFALLIAVGFQAPAYAQERGGDTEVPSGRAVRLGEVTIPRDTAGMEQISLRQRDDGGWTTTYYRSNASGTSTWHGRHTDADGNYVGSNITVFHENGMQYDMLLDQNGQQLGPVRFRSIPEGAGGSQTTLQHPNLPDDGDTSAITVGPDAKKAPVVRGNRIECRDAHGHDTPAYNRCMGDEGRARYLECRDAHGHNTPAYNRCMGDEGRARYLECRDAHGHDTPAYNRCMGNEGRARYLEGRR